jgi:hypothetical protein
LLIVLQKVLDDFKMLVHTFHPDWNVKIDYTMANAESAQYVAFQEAFELEANQLLMCYFHVLDSVHKELWKRRFP